MQKRVKHVQSYCFANINLLLLCRSRYCCPSSLLQAPYCCSPLYCRLRCKPLEFPVKSDTITQMLTEILIRGRQRTREVKISGVVYFKQKKQG